MSNLETVAAESRLAECVSILGRLTAEVESGRRDYAAVRKRFLYLNAYLNEPWHGHRLVGPAYRPQVTYERFEGRPVGERIFEDQYRIDVHWLLCSDGSVKAEHYLSALYAGEEIPEEPESDPFLVEGVRMINGRILNCRQQLECVWYCAESLRQKRAELLKERGEHRHRLQDRLRAADVRESNSLRRINIAKLCDIWFAERIALLMFDGQQPSPELHAQVYREITGDVSVSRDSIRHQGAQVDKYILGLPLRRRVRGHSLSARRARSRGGFGPFLRLGQ